MCICFATRSRCGGCNNWTLRVWNGIWLDQHGYWFWVYDWLAAWWNSSRCHAVCRWCRNWSAHPRRNHRYFFNGCRPIWRWNNDVWWFIWIISWSNKARYRIDSSPWLTYRYGNYHRVVRCSCRLGFNNLSWLWRCFQRRCLLCRVPWCSRANLWPWYWYVYGLWYNNLLWPRR